MLSYRTIRASCHEIGNRGPPVGLLNVERVKLDVRNSRSLKRHEAGHFIFGGSCDAVALLRDSAALTVTGTLLQLCRIIEHYFSADIPCQ